MPESLVPRDATFDFSFIIATRNNFQELTSSIISIVAEAPASSEIVVIDGSDVPFGREAIAQIVGSNCVSLTYDLDTKTGVFDAMNVGVRKTSGRWLIMIPAGDLMKAGARALLESIVNSELDAVVFAQDIAEPSGRVAYTFFPTSTSVWPHHSVALRRTVHEQLGLYPKEYRYTSDQHFFAIVRKKVRWELRSEILTVFLLGGISSGASLKMSREIYSFRRRNGQGLVTSGLRAYVFPYVRSWLEQRTGFGGIVPRLRQLMFASIKSAS